MWQKRRTEWTLSVQPQGNIRLENSFTIWEQYQAQRTHSQSESNIRLKELIQCNLRAKSAPENLFTIWEQYQAQRTRSVQPQSSNRLRELIHNLRAISGSENLFTIWEQYQTQRSHSVQPESNIRLREPIYNLKAISYSKNSFSATWEQNQAQLTHLQFERNIKCQNILSFLLYKIKDVVAQKVRDSFMLYISPERQNKKKLASSLTNDLFYHMHLNI
jgi:hypothetical protein